MNQFDNDVSIDRFEMFDDRHYRKVDLRYFCQSAAPALLFPDGVDISYEMHSRATEIARQVAMDELSRRWFGKPRGSGTVHLIRSTDDTCEEDATTG